MAGFLFEIGLEELPARMISGAAAELLRRLTSMLCRQNLMDARDVERARSFSTPRRLAVYVPEVFDKQADSSLKQTGPSAKIAFKDGVPTPAAESFAKKNGVSVADLKIVNTDKGDYVMADVAVKGRKAADVLAAELPKEIAAIYWAKSMYWRPGKPERFVRPVLWMVCLLGDEVVPITFAGKIAGRASFGHRVLSSGGPFEIQTPASYLAQMEGEYVLADVEARRHRIRKALDKATRVVHGARWREDEALVDTVTHLTEWPEVLLGSFEPAYLALPEEVLVTVMRDHQKYFAVEDSLVSGEKPKLAPHFLTVTNIALDAENAAIIRQGNERVLRARFNDARFFWEFDQRISLADRVKLLEGVTFQKELGSYAAKSKRVRALAAKLGAVASERGAALDLSALDEAARLAKVDLTTELVKEFTELQGIIGGLYGQAEGKTEITWQAIYDQYLPASADDRIPRSPEGALLGLADRIDTISGMFGLGMEPTGSKDPFALRRAANAVVRILAESGLPLCLSDVLSAAPSEASVRGRLDAFFAERIDFYLREVRGNAYDVVKAVLAAGHDDLRAAAARSEAVTAMRGSDDFLAVSAAFKRMKNILAQAQEKGIAARASVDPGLLADPTEMALAERSIEVAAIVEALRSTGNYRAALEAVSTLRPQVDAFFDKVMVMTNDEAVRANRLALLSQITGDLSRIADFSEIVTTG